jgi:hypothetical protein
MPNWCNNTLNVSGDEKSIAAFMAAARGRHAGYPRISANGGTVWPSHDEVRVQALTKAPSPLGPNEHEFCMNALYPVPEDYRRFPFDDNAARCVGAIIDEPRKHGGYKWQTDHWGCKWDVDGELVSNEEMFLQYEFQSPWSPPISFFEKVAKDFPSLTFELEYYEDGMGYAGRNTFNDDDYFEEELDIDELVGE